MRTRTSVNTAVTTATAGGGILLYNTQLDAFDSGCADPLNTFGVACIKPIDLNGSDANIQFYPLQDGSTWNNLIIFQDADFNMTGANLKLNGSSSSMILRGTIYLPNGDVNANGNSAEDLVVDQVIAYTFSFNGNGGSITILNDEDYIVTFSAAGLVE